MKIKVRKSMFTEALQNIITVIPSRTTLPILSATLMEADNTSLCLTATDLEICVKREIEIEVVDSGKITVPGKKLYDIVREIPSEEILIESTKNFAILIRGKNSFFKLLGFSPEEYPEIPKIEGKSIQISSSLLRDMLTKTYFACSREETRYILNGVLFDFSPVSLKLVASDGRRLALSQEKIEVNWQGKYIIPQKAVMELLKILESKDKKVEINFGQKSNQIGFYSNHTQLITRLIEGDFPNYEEVIPQESANQLRVGKEEFYQAVKRVSLMTTSDSIAVKLEVYRDKLVISKITPEVGEAREELEVDYKGEEMVIGFNPQYLLDVLRNIDEEEIGFELNGPDKPGVIRLDKEYIYLVLPMQLI